jgi:hypothetical protein
METYEINPPTSILLMMIEEERIAVAADLILLIKVQLALSYL